MGLFDQLNNTIKTVWGEDVLYDYGGAFLPLTAVFDDDAEIVTGDLEIVSSGPRLFVKLADFPSGITPENTHKVKIRERWYAVAEVLPDGQGAAELFLKVTED